VIDEADVPAYEKRAQQLIREINSIVIPDAKHVVEVGEQLINFSALWNKADRAHRQAILREMFEAVYVDTDTKQIVGVRPYAAFVPMFRQTMLVERDWQFVLENKEIAPGGSTPERSYVLNGSDGRRSCARREG
jgi:hypothetical protein